MAELLALLALCLLGRACERGENPTREPATL
jgi:hypothetical protein